MKTQIAVIVMMFFAGIAGAQEVPSQIVCRPLEKGPYNYVTSDETIIGNKACRAVPLPKADPPANPVVPAPQPAVTAAKPPAAAPAPAASTESTPVTPTPQPASVPALRPDRLPTVPAAVASGGDAAHLSFEAQAARARISRGMTIAIAPMENGADSYLAAAFQRRKVPVELTLDPSQSDFLLVSTETDWHQWFDNANADAKGRSSGEGSKFSSLFNFHSVRHAGDLRNLESAVMLVDKRTGKVEWSWATENKSGSQQEIADSVAKGLKRFIEKGK